MSDVESPSANPLEAARREAQAAQALEAKMNLETEGSDFEIEEDEAEEQVERLKEVYEDPNATVEAKMAAKRTALEAAGGFTPEQIRSMLEREFGPDLIGEEKVVERKAEAAAPPPAQKLESDIPTDQQEFKDLQAQNLEYVTELQELEGQIRRLQAENQPDRQRIAELDAQADELAEKRNKVRALLKENPIAQQRMEERRKTTGSPQAEALIQRLRAKRAGKQAEEAGTRQEQATAERKARQARHRELVPKSEPVEEEEKKESGWEKPEPLGFTAEDLIRRIKSRPKPKKTRPVGQLAERIAAAREEREDLGQLMRDVDEKVERTQEELRAAEAAENDEDTTKLRDTLGKLEKRKAQLAKRIEIGLSPQKVSRKEEMREAAENEQLIQEAIEREKRGELLPPDKNPPEAPDETPPEERETEPYEKEEKATDVTEATEATEVKAKHQEYTEHPTEEIELTDKVQKKLVDLAIAGASPQEIIDALPDDVKAELAKEKTFEFVERFREGEPVVLDVMFDDRLEDDFLKSKSLSPDDQQNGMLAMHLAENGAKIVLKEITGDNKYRFAVDDKDWPKGKTFILDNYQVERAMNLADSALGRQAAK